jgi:hypothetical protein
MLYPLSYEGGDLSVQVRRYLSVAGDRALGRRAFVAPNRDRVTIVRGCLRVGVVSSMPYLCASCLRKRDTARGNLGPDAVRQLSGRQSPGAGVDPERGQSPWFGVQGRSWNRVIRSGRGVGLPGAT